MFVVSIPFIRIIIIIIMWLLMNHYKGSRIISLQIWEEDYINNIQYPNLDFAYVRRNLLRLDAAAKIHHIKSVQVVRHLFIHGQRVTYCLFPNWVGDQSYKYLSHSICKILLLHLFYLYHPTPRLHLFSMSKYLPTP